MSDEEIENKKWDRAQAFLHRLDAHPAQRLTITMRYLDERDAENATLRADVEYWKNNSKRIGEQLCEESEICFSLRARLSAMEKVVMKAELNIDLRPKFDKSFIDTEYAEKLIALSSVEKAAPEHKCEPYDEGCCCYQLADEPSENCVKHGGAVKKPRCSCGKFCPPEAKPAEKKYPPSRERWAGSENRPCGCKESGRSDCAKQSGQAWDMFCNCDCHAIPPALPEPKVDCDDCGIRPHSVCPYDAPKPKAEEKHAVNLMVMCECGHEAGVHYGNGNPKACPGYCSAKLCHCNIFKPALPEPGEKEGEGK